MDSKDILHDLKAAHHMLGHRMPLAHQVIGAYHPSEFIQKAYNAYDDAIDALESRLYIVPDERQELLDRIKELEDDLACYRAMSMDSNQKA